MKFTNHHQSCFVASFLIVLLVGSSCCNAFTTTSPHSFGGGGGVVSQQQQMRRTTPQLHLVPLDLSEVAATAVTNHYPDLLLAAEEATGWWASYLNIFKISLEFVHNTITPVFNSMGVEQTWGISIALFTIAIRGLLVPLSIEQSKSAEYMKALKPYMKEINEKYKDNEQVKNRAIAKLYEDAKQNPLAGCFVSLAQLPIFLGLYRGVRLLALDGELQEPFLWIPSLEGPVSAATDFRGLDWLTSGWVNGAPSMGWETTLAFLAMPIILVVLQSVTMQVLQPPVDENVGEEEKATLERTQAILRFLPLLIGFFSLQVPAGLTIYWFSSNIFTLTQSLAVRAYFAANPPQIELPDYWDQALSGDAENMSPEERRKASEAGIRVGPTFKELVDQAQFHVLVERTKSLREETDAWQRVSSVAAAASVPKEMEEWVRANAQTNNDNNNNNSHNNNNNNNNKHQEVPTMSTSKSMNETLATASST